MEKDNQQFYKKLGWTLRSQRRGNKISSNVIARELKITIQQLQKYEVGENRIPIDKFVKYCELLKVKPDWLSDWAKGKELKI